VCTFTALEAPKRAGVTVSFGVHYRAKLWSPEEAQRVLRPLLTYCDIVFANEDDIRYGLGVARSRTERSGETGSSESYRQVAERVAEEFGIQMVAMTVRERMSASESVWSGLLYERGKVVPRDDGRAVHYSGRACDAGHLAGCATRGCMIAEGLGVPKDEARAATICAEACEAGGSIACSNLGVLYAHGRGVPKDQARAVELYGRACDFGSPAGCPMIQII
jgi:TPR repeat protein